MASLFATGKVEYLLPSSVGVVAPATLELGGDGNLEFVPNSVPGNTVTVEYEISIAGGAYNPGMMVQFIKRNGIVTAIITNPAAATTAASNTTPNVALMRTVAASPQLLGYLPIAPVLAYIGAFGFQESTGGPTVVGDLTVSDLGVFAFNAEAGSTFTDSSAYVVGMTGGPTETQYLLGSWTI